MHSGGLGKRGLVFDERLYPLANTRRTNKATPNRILLLVLKYHENIISHQHLVSTLCVPSSNAHLPRVGKPASPHHLNHNTITPPN